MNYWEFNSINGWFSTKLPGNWSEYDDDEGTYAFFNTIEWSGNLRITPVRLSSTKIDKTPTIITPDNNPNTTVIKLGAWIANFYSERSSDGCIIYYWVIGSTSIWFMCSFTINEEFFNTDRNTKELAVVEEVISNIEILN
jgi:hypothetical protein